jgi:hypothetical protein
MDAFIERDSRRSINGPFFDHRHEDAGPTGTRRSPERRVGAVLATVRKMADEAGLVAPLLEWQRSELVAALLRLRPRRPPAQYGCNEVLVLPRPLWASGNPP